MTGLTKQDYDVLIEAVKAWETKDNMGHMMGSMMGAMLCQDDDAREKLKEKEKQEALSREAAMKSRQERSIVLRAKLIAIRDAVVAEAFVDSAGQ